MASRGYRQDRERWEKQLANTETVIARIDRKLAGLPDHEKGLRSRRAQALADRASYLKQLGREHEIVEKQ